MTYSPRQVARKYGGRAVHSDEPADRKLFKKLINEHEKNEDKYAKGGKVKPHLKNPSRISRPPVSLPSSPPDAGLAAGQPGAPMPSPMLAGSALSPPGAPMMRKSGGNTLPGGISTKENITKWAKRASDNSYASGGKVAMRGGGDSGLGRLDKIKAYGARARSK